MALHVFANIVTPFGTAANNRGETEGNITTLQKLIWLGMAYSTVSAEAIRFALRRLLADQEQAGTNRTYNELKRVNEWKDSNFTTWASEGGQSYIDDDLLGFMSAEAAKGEAESPAPEEAEQSTEEGDKKLTKKKKKKPKGTATVRRGVLEITRAVSLTSWPGDVTFNAASPRATASAAKGEGDNPVPYGTEVHATRYQYGLALTPERLRDKSRAGKALLSICQLGTVAGNHSRFLFDFAPDAIVFRITDDPAPRFLYCFLTTDDGRTIDAPTLVDRVQSADIRPEELILGGSITSTPTGEKLRDKGAVVLPGVKTATEEAVKRINRKLGIEG